MTSQDLGPVESAILEILKEEPMTPYLSISRALNISNERLMQALQELSKAEAIVIEISEVIDSSQRITKVTEKGEKILKDIKPMEERFEIRYVYGLRSGAGSSLVIDTTRDFCSKLCKKTAGESGGKKTGGQLGGTTTWDLEEIVNMGVKADRNVWQRGGGFWGNSYHCRHEWKQVIVKEKR